MFFQPGKLVHTFVTKSGKTAELIYPKWEVLDQLLEYINTLSSEDTFIRFSGEQQTLEQEAKYLSSIFVSMELKQSIYLYCLIDGQLVGVCEVSKLTELKERGRHVSRFGLSVAREFRNEGIGYELSKATIEQAKQNLDGLKVVVLTCFANNQPALNLYKKLGFVEVGRLPSHLLYKGEYVDEVQMSLSIA